MESTNFSGGRVVFTSSGSDVQYHVTDYLGSVRVVADRDGKLLEKIDYYPFGKRIETAQQQVTGNRYLYNGKEWQSTGRVCTIPIWEGGLDKTRNINPRKSLCQTITEDLFINIKQ